MTITGDRVYEVSFDNVEIPVENMIGQMDILMDEGSDTDAPHPCHESVKRTP